MTKMDKRWKLVKDDEEETAALQHDLGIHPVICKILSQRNIKRFEEAKDFFRPQLAHLHDPWLMKDMRKAVDRIMNAVEKKEKILVFGDYDVDGTTSVATMYSFLREFHSHIDFYIPHRYREGYGVSKAGIDHAIANNFTLIISLDCGIKSYDLISYAKQFGIDFIICDHHLPDQQLPPAVAILNPKQSDCSYPFKDLCGCGVGFKLITALTQVLNVPAERAYRYLDLVATAIAADIVSMTGENRIMAYFGLKQANEDPNFGIKALAQLSGLKGAIGITNLLFMIAPRVNAAGRMDDARKAVELFISSTMTEALAYAELLHADNSTRRETDLAITQEALQLIQDNSEWTTRKSTVVFQTHWHKGVVGIVASRLIEHHYRPTIVLTQSGDYAAGSARSVPGFNLYEAIHACKDHLIGYGGHFAAAGMTLSLDKVEAFRDRFEEVVAATIDPHLLIPELVIDSTIKFIDIRQNFYKIIEQMAPFGPDNLQPVFIARNVYDTGYSKTLRDIHLRFSLIQDNVLLTGIGFNMADKLSLLQSKAPVDIVFRIEENEWQSESRLQLKIIDCRASELVSE